MGVNAQGELAQAEALFQKVQRETFLAAGVTMAAPETVHFAWDTRGRRRIDRSSRSSSSAPAREGRRARPHPQLQPHRGRDGRLRRRGRPLCPPASRRGSGRGGARSATSSRSRTSRMDAGRQGQPPGLSRRRHGRGGREHRRGHDLLQLRRLQQGDDDGGRGGLRRLQLGPGRAGDHRRGRHRRLGLGDRRGRAGRTPWPWRAGVRSNKDGAGAAFRDKAKAKKAAKSK